MTRHGFVRRSRLPVGAEAAYAWHAREGALERLLPPWKNVRVVRRTGGLADGSQVELLLRVGPAPVAWVAEIRDCRPPEQFRDVQLRGPMAHWDHLHRFEPEGPRACTLEDRVEYALPAGPIGVAVDAAWV
ncbi:MAG: SRPBCC family protein, partial [Planctomycetia bacterium]|nr:SRPBCC family protein [Planctomycetia bacterium]